ncbi:ankyrin repeat domain-containing protein [Algicella marina]|uniref:Ankyrin repeat domain-containing protein n=1 Tax=Algicella marina TaxID=2683284 RepID=A0A6P1T4L7_9RHOB|nr:ankyrin repeat domain-containing protein [Algicella marina]QHQ36650.1 ankyrin repeat domain-containing protein [Algicella marina]
MSDLETYRRAAKVLKKAFHAGDAQALATLRAHVVTAEPKHSDFLHAIAREAGAESWPKLKHALELAGLTREEQMRRLMHASIFGHGWRIDQLLAQDPGLARGSMALATALYRRADVARMLEKDPTAATRVEGIRSPILTLAFSRYHAVAPAARDDMLAIAEMLLDRGADVNDSYQPEPNSPHRLSALYGAIGHSRNLPLARWLLEHGAATDDDESLYHSTEMGHAEGLRLLLGHGARVSGTNALPRAIDFKDAEMVRLLLEHGANPDEAVEDHPSGEPIDSIPALHHAARRWAGADVAALLLDHGADATRVWHGHTPYATARIYGNAEVAQFLASRGHATPLDPLEQALAACAEGRPAPRIDGSALSCADREIMAQVVLEKDRLYHLRALVEAGLDINAPDYMGMTPLHFAVWGGLPEQTAFLLTRNPDLDHVNKYGGDTFGTLIHGADNRTDTAERDHIACADLLFAAGLRPTPVQLRGTGYEPLARHLEDRIAELS